MKNIDTFTPQEIADKLQEACANDNVNFVKEFLQSNWLIHESKFDQFMVAMIKECCILGRLEIMKVLFESPFEKYFNNSLNISQFMNYSSQYGHIDIVKYLTDTPSIKINHNSTILYFGTMCAAQYGHLNILKYFVETHENYMSNIPNPEKEIFDAACCKDNNILVLQYLISLPNYNLQKNLAKGFETACEKQALENLRYLIFELNIEKTESIKKYLNTYPNKDVEKMFEIRDLNNSLQNNLLTSSKNKNRTMKV
jgi:hypothetical protein